MSDAIRSNGGCWTCRIRRKKCDETKPTCLTCSSLLIPCHGYGPKPNWMDRGAREREVAISLRNVVKQTLRMQRLRISRHPHNDDQGHSDEALSSSHRRSASISDDSSIEEVLDSDLPLENSDSTNPSSIALNLTASPTVRSFSSDDSNSSQNSPDWLNLVSRTNNDAKRIDVRDLILTKESWSTLPAYFEDEQAILLMHFFDHVLPLQFRFYNPSIVEGGRGWLLSTIIRTKPLYNVALSLAAYHQQSVLVREGDVSCAVSLSKLEERHIECIKALRYHLEKILIGDQTESYETNIETMACIAILIALELFRGDTSSWQTHLRAASNLSLKFRPDQLKTSPLSHTHKLAIGFFQGVIAWYDILSCASTGLRPSLDLRLSNEEVLPRIRFDKLMGCEDWLMHIIYEIATLSEWKTSLEATGSLSMWELVRRAADIEMRLETGLIMSSPTPIEPSSTTETTTSRNISESLVRDVTQVFAGAAFVCLQVIISGPHPDIPEIQKGVSRTTAALDALKDKELIRNLLWPVCIAGCMATVEYESYWRDLISKVSQDRWSFGYPSKVLKIMEECWRLRKSKPGTVMTVDWMTAMKSLGLKVLLV